MVETTTPDDETRSKTCGLFRKSFGQ